MNFGFTEEQDLLRSEVHKFLTKRCPLSEVRRIGEEQQGFCAKLWSEIVELGWPSLTISEEHGGAGLAWIDLVVLLEEAGRHLLPLPPALHHHGRAGVYRGRERDATGGLVAASRRW